MDEDPDLNSDIELAEKGNSKTGSTKSSDASYATRAGMVEEIEPWLNMRPS